MKSVDGPNAAPDGTVRPLVVAFDVFETLASLAPVAARIDRRGLPTDLLHRWFTRILRDGMALTASGDFAPFGAVAASALRAEAGGHPSDADLEFVMGGFDELVAQPDAASAVHAARDAGFGVITLSNGAAASTRGFLERAGIADVVDQVVSIDDAGAWKPTAAPYELAAARAGVHPTRMALVAVHSWDVHGAQRIGCSTGWCSRLEGTPTAVFAAATVSASNLDDVIRGLAELPPDRGSAT